jgi:hypothetical protein
MSEPTLSAAEELAAARWRPTCDCGAKATHSCSYCYGVCDNCIDHCERFGHVWVVHYS